MGSELRSFTDALCASGPADDRAEQMAAGRRVRGKDLHHHIGARKTKNAPPAINANPITWFQVIACCK